MPNSCGRRQWLGGIAQTTSTTTSRHLGLRTTTGAPASVGREPDSKVSFATGAHGLRDHQSDAGTPSLVALQSLPVVLTKIALPRCHWVQETLS